jgi:hypothetical protein
MIQLMNAKGLSKFLRAIVAVLFVTAAMPVPAQEPPARPDGQTNPGGARDSDGSATTCREIAAKMKEIRKFVKLDKSSSLPVRCAALGQTLGMLQAARAFAEVCDFGGGAIWASYIKAVDGAVKLAQQTLASECK